MILDKKAVNTGRQMEFDYLKGLFIPLILLIHAFQMLSGTGAPVFQVIYILGTMTGSTIFLFTMGLGSAYSKRTPGQLARAGVRLLVYELLWNVLAMVVPFFLGQGIRVLLGLDISESWPMTLAQCQMLVQYINIFFMAGVTYLIMALLKKWRLPDVGYLLLALVFLIGSPFWYMPGKTTGNAALDYVLTMFAGGRAGVSMCFLPHFAYAMFGVWFGQKLRRVLDKGLLYRRMVPVTALIVIAYLAYAIGTHGDSLGDLYRFSGTEYIYPSTFRMVATLSCTLLAAAVLYALREKIQALAPVHNTLLHFSRKTSQYYAVHPFFFALVFSAAALAPFGWAACFGLTVVNTGLCYAALKVWDQFCTWRNKKRAS